MDVDDGDRMDGAPDHVYRVIFVDPAEPLPAGATELGEGLQPEAAAVLAAMLERDARRWYADPRTATDRHRDLWGPTPRRTRAVKLTIF